MYYGNKTAKEIDDYYAINTDNTKYPWWQHHDCEKIQQAFNNHAIMLTLAECKLIYQVYSDKSYCTSWKGGLEDMTEEYIFILLLPWLIDILGDRVNRIDILSEQLSQNGYI